MARVAREVAALDDAALYGRLCEAGRRLVRWRIEVLLALVEVERRRLHLKRGFGSLGEFIVEILHLSEGLAYTYAWLVHGLRRFPLVAEALADGALTPTGARRLVPALHKLPAEAHAGLVAACRGKPTSTIEKLVRDALCAAEEAETAPGETVTGPAACPLPLLGDGGVGSPQPRARGAAPETRRSGPVAPSGSCANAGPDAVHGGDLDGARHGGDSVSPAQPAKRPGAGSRGARRGTMSVRQLGGGAVTVTLHNVPVEVAELLEELLALEAHAVRNRDVGAVLCRALKARREALVRRRFGSPRARNASKPTSSTPLLSAGRGADTPDTTGRAPREGDCTTNAGGRPPAAGRDGAVQAAGGTQSKSDPGEAPAASDGAPAHGEGAHCGACGEASALDAVPGDSSRDELTGTAGGVQRERGTGTGERLSGPGRRRKPRRRKAIPAAVRREVYERDGGRCAYVDPETGRRCGSQDGLQFEHRVPVALGGKDTVENVMLLCRHHNLLRAEQVFGRERIGAIIARKRAQRE